LCFRFASVASETTESAIRRILNRKPKYPIAKITNGFASKQRLLYRTTHLYLVLVKGTPGRTEFYSWHLEEFRWLENGRDA
jgi:hypothetical protein